MRKIHAFRIDDGRIFPTHAEAKKAAQRAYDDHMTTIRVGLTERTGSVQAAAKALAWIEQNFDRIALASRLGVDVDIVEDTTENEDD